MAFKDIFKGAESLTVKFNAETLGLLRKAQRVLGLISDMEALQVAAALLQAATVAKENGKKLAIVNDNDEVEAAIEITTKGEPGVEVNVYPGSDLARRVGLEPPKSTKAPAAAQKL